MPIDLGAVGAANEPTVTTWTSTDCLLYALGVGAGADDPLNPVELQFTTEGVTGIEQRVLPTFAFERWLGKGSPLDFVGPFDRTMMVNAQQTLTLHRPLPVEGSVEGCNRVVAIHDKGSGALVLLEGEAVDTVTRQPMWTVRTGIFIRGEGGWGGDRGTSSSANAAPDRKPDHAITYATRHDQALLYRLCGDRAAIHADPVIAQRAGFARPILHGRCTMGITGRALLHELCGSDPERFRSIEGRFAKPVLPGDTLTISVWIIGDGEALFRTTGGDGTVVLDAGRCTFAN